MFKLLLVTDRPEVRATFEGITDWERIGFRTPRYASCVEEAVDSLTHHHADAIAVSLPPEEEKRMIQAMATPRWHLRPILIIPEDTGDLMRDLGELELLLSRTHADYSNDQYSEESMMQLARHEFLRRVIAGQEQNPAHIRRYLRLLRSQMDPDKPCVLIALDYPDDDGYLSDHWKYGADRLEVAMRNIFGAELEGIRMLVSVLPDERIYLLACPMLDRETVSGPEMVELVCSHTEWAIGHVRDYLKIEMDIAAVYTAPNLCALNQLQEET